MSSYSFTKEQDWYETLYYLVNKLFTIANQRSKTAEWPESWEGSSKEHFSRISEAARGSVLLGLHGTLHTFGSPPRTFQTSAAGSGTSSAPSHRWDCCPSRSAWACWRACGEVWQWAGRAWEWSAGWSCWWWGSHGCWSFPDLNSCGFHFLPG